MKTRIESMVSAALVAVVLNGAMAGTASAASISTTGTFTGWTGDVDPTSGPGAGAFEVFVNDTRVAPETTIAGNYFQGFLDLPVGTTSVEFKNRQPGLPFNTPNLISFAGAVTTAPASLKTPFLLGTITVTNGIWFSQAGAWLTVKTSSPGTAFNERSFTDFVHYVVTPNLGIDPAVDADYVEFSGHPQLGQIRVYEASSGLGNTGTVELYGVAGSLIPLYFANATGGVYINAVPEPRTWVMLALGIVALFATMRRPRPALHPA